ncbi:MAG: hypothetical protein ACRYFX_23305 [Janthinobacterium lividum]
MRNHTLLLSAGLVLAGCSKKHDEAPAPASKDFTVGYYFTNEGDANLSTVSLVTRTFYPGKTSSGNVLQMFDNIYQNITPTQKIAHLFTEPHMNKTLYPGCLTYMKVYLGFRNPVYTPYPASQPPQGGYLYRIFELPVDTVTAAANCTRSFNWPSDTLKYKEVRAYY